MATCLVREAVLTEAQLVAAARAGDEAAFAEIVRLCEPAVAATVYGMLGDCAEAEDIGQETFVRLYKSLDRFRGEFFTDRDVTANAKVAVLGQTVAEELFGQQDAIGQRIQIGGTPLKVVGVMTEKGQNAMGMDEDDVIIAPATTVLYRIKGGTYIDMINAKAVSAEKLDAAQAEIRTTLREAHGLREGEDDDFNIRNLAELTEMATETSEILTLLLGSIAAVAISLLLNNVLGVATSLNPWVAALAFTVSGAVGVFFGLWPARKAAALNPIDALRYE